MTKIQLQKAAYVYILALVFITVFLLLTSACAWPGGSGGGGAKETERYGEKQFHAQLTAMQETAQP